jgi:hypothetical protein
MLGTRVSIDADIFIRKRRNDKPLVRIAIECDSLGSLGKIGVGYDGSNKER